MGWLFFRAMLTLRAMRLHKNITLLGVVSMLTDLSSQMIYPFIPEFLLQLGTSVSNIGIIEGIAEATAETFKAWAGKLTDKYKKYKLLVFIGYGLSALAKPILFFAQVWGHVLAVKFIERVGKAVRNPPRDVLLSASVAPSHHGIAFGLHRAYDRIGSFAGPLVAMGLLYFFPGNLRLVFLCAAVPGLLALLFIKNVQVLPAQPKHKAKGGHRNSLQNQQYLKRFIIVGFLFMLGNASNAFLLLKASEVGIALFWLPVLWAAYNGVCALAAPKLGALSDSKGRKPVILAACLYQAIIYGCFAFASLQWHVWALFLAYGIQYGLTKGVFKAFVADLAPVTRRGTAFGMYDMWMGLGLLLASVLMGTLWQQYTPKIAFLTAAAFGVVAAAVFFLLFFIKPQKQAYPL